MAGGLQRATVSPVSGAGGGALGCHSFHLCVVVTEGRGSQSGRAVGGKGLCRWPGAGPVGRGGQNAGPWAHPGPE